MFVLSLSKLNQISFVLFLYNPINALMYLNQNKDNTFLLPFDRAPF